MGEVGLNRRAMLRSGLAWTAGAALTPVLAGCVRSAAVPTVASPVQTVIFQLNVQGPNNATVQQLVQQYVDQSFNAGHRGIRAIYQRWGNITGVIAQTIAGNGPYVISSCCNDFATAIPFLAPLDPWLQKDNLSPDGWSTGQLQTFQLGQGLFGVPAYTCVQPYFYRQDVLDELGLSYPAPDWTYQDAQRLWAACASTTGGKRRYGASLPTSAGDIANGVCLLEGFGGAYMDSSRTKCLLDLPGSIAGVEYTAQLILNGVCTFGGGVVNPMLATGQMVFSQGAGGALLWVVENLGSSVKWDIVPYPRWPVRPASSVQVDFYGMNAEVPNQELAWELFKYATIDPAWTRFIMRMTLQQPALLSLWDEWETILRSVAPVLRTKAIQWWKTGAQEGWGYGTRFFKYQPSAAIGVFDQAWPKIWNRQLSVTAACRTIAQQVTAFEAAAAAEGPAPTAAQIIAGQKLARGQLGTMFSGASG